MPNNTLEKWEEKTIKQLTTLICDGDWIESKNQSSSGIRLIQTGNVGDGYYKDKPENARYISEDTFKKLNCTEIFSGDCLVSRLPEPLGRACLIPDRKERMITAVDCSIIRFNDKLIVPKYFIYYSMSNFYHTKIINLSTGATRQRISRKNLETITIPVPKIEEQQRIVGILDEAFENIEKAKQNTLQNLNNTKELYKNIQSSIFNEPFEEKELGEICTLYQGLAINAKTKHLLCDKSTLPLLRIKDLKENCETQFVKEEGYPENALVNENNIIYTRTGSLGLVFKGRRGILHNNSFKVIPNSLIDNDYLFEWLQNPIFNKQIIELAQRAAQPDITHALFKQQIINIPPLELQLKKVKEIRTIREYVEKLEQIYTQKLQNLDELKQSILQKAFNGEL